VIAETVRSDLHVRDFLLMSGLLSLRAAWSQAGLHHVITSFHVICPPNKVCVITLPSKILITTVGLRALSIYGLSCYLLLKHIGLQLAHLTRFV